MAYFSYLTKNRPAPRASAKTSKRERRRGNASAYDCTRCGLDKDCKSPRMKGVGPKNAGIMIIGEAPGKREDLNGKPFIGSSGTLLRTEFTKATGISSNDVFITNAVRCRPPENKTPTKAQIKNCWAFLEKEIMEVKPKLIVLVGGTAINSVIGAGGAFKLRGTHIPTMEFGFPTVLAPILHPAFVDRSKDLTIGVFRKDLRALKKAIKKKVNIKTYIDNNTVIEDADELIYLLEDIRKNEKPFSQDWETQGVSPFNHKTGFIVSSAIATSYKKSFTYIMEDHCTGRPWTDREWKHIKKEHGRLFTSDCIKIFHNYKFEKKWAIQRLGTDILYNIRDVMYQGHIIRELKGAKDLDFLSYINFGIRKIPEADRFKKDMFNCPPNILHPYGGLDAKLTFRLDKRQYKQLDDSDLWVMDNLLIDGAHATAWSEIGGAIIDEKKRKKFSKKYGKKREELREELLSDKRAKKFIRENKKLDLGSSSRDMPKFFKHELGMDVPKTEKGQYSVTNDFLDLHAGREPFCGMLKEFRQTDNLLNTFIDGIKEVIHEDGKLHTEYGLTTTETGRASSKRPNLQNIPKRNSQWIRKMFIPPPGHVMMALDYKGAEIRGMAMYSKDKTLIREINEDYDSHKEWGIQLLGKGKTDAERKEIRFQGKNGFVFPTYYGASYKSIARNLQLPEKKVKKIQDKFFKKYPAIKEWQLETIDFYKRHGYVETLFGRKRHAPLTYNKIINSPIQGLASDFTLLSWIRAHDAGFTVPLMIHDDITLYVPEDDIENTFNEVSAIMSEWSDFDFVNVPMEVECEVGYNWCNMFPIEQFLN